MYQNVADESISAADASSFLISQMIAFNIEAENSEHIIDAVNEVANRFAVSSGDLSGALGIVASTSSAMGNSFEETLGMLTAITEQTRNSNRAARGLNSIFNNLAQVLDDASSNGKKITDIFNDLDISMYDNEDQLRSSYELLGELAAQWDTLDTNTQNYIASTIAGTNQLNNFLALMNNFEHATEATATGLDSAGSAAEENAKWMESLEASVQQIKATFQEFALNLIDSGLVKTLLELGNAFLELLDTPVGRAITQFTLLNGLWLGAGSILSNYVKNIKPAITGTADFVKGLFNFVSSSKKAADGASTVASGIKNVGNSAKTASTGVSMFGAAMNTLFGVITLVISVIDAINSAQEEARQNAINNSQAHLDQAESLKALKDEYIEILDSEATETEKDKALVEWKSKLVEQYGFEEEALKNVNNERENTLALLDEEIAKQASLSWADIRSQFEKAASKIENVGSETTIPLGIDFSYVEQDFHDLLNNLEQYGINFEWFGDSLGMGFDAFDTLYDKQQALSDAYNMALDSRVAGADVIANLIQHELDGTTDLIDKWGEAYQQGIDAMAQYALTNTYAEQITQVGTEEAYNTLVERIKEEVQWMGAQEEILATLAKWFPQYSGYVEEAADKNEDLGDSNADAAESFEDLIAALQGTMDALGELSGSFDTITDALEDFQDDGEVTFSTLSNLLDTFSDVEGIEDFISQLAEGGMSAEEFKTALDNLTYAKIQNAIETQGLENADANLIAKMLEEAGVANADEVAMAALTNAKINATLQTDGLTNAVYNEIMELVNEQGQTEATRQAIAAYWFEKALANANTIKTAADIENLISLASAAGQTSVVIDQLRLAIDYFNKAASEPNPTISAWHSKTAMNYLNRAKQLSAVSRGSGGNVSAGPAISYVPSGGSSSSSGGGSGSSGGGTSSTVEDTTDPELERHKDIVEALKTELDIMQAKNEPYDAQIRKMQEIQNALHEQAEYMRSIGATEQEINELSLEWWNIQNDINDLLEEALDTYKEYLEEQAEGIESALDYAISQAEKEIENIEDWYDQLIAEEEARQEALEQTNEELENQIALEEKLDAIARARSKKLLVYKDGRFQYVQDIDEVSAAQSDYQQYLYEQQQQKQEQSAQDEIDRLEAEREEAISIWEQYIKDWESVVDSYEDAQDRLLAEQILGIDFEQKNWAERLGNAEEFAKKYAEIMDEIASINEMQDLGELVDMNVDYSALMLQAPNEQIFNALAALRDWKAHILGIDDYTEAGFRTNEELRQEMGFAKGTLSAPGGLSLVGENGPELRVLNQGDGIIPANLTKNLMDLALNPAGTGDTNINIENVNLPNVQNGQDFVDYLRSNIWRKTIQYKTSKR